MRRIRYQVASSLDGYIAGPQGEYDWIVDEPDIDFNEIYRQFDTLLMGRRTFEILPAGSEGSHRIVVVSHTLDPAKYPHVTVINDNVEARVRELREKAGKDIWLFGGGQLLRTLLDAGLVDTMEIAVIPVIVGGGIPMVAVPARRQSLKLTSMQRYPKSGIVMLNYDVVR